MFLEYKLHRGPRGMICPYWIEDGGYWHDPDDYTMIGWTPDEKDRKYYVPDTVESFTVAQLIARQQGIHSRYPMTDIDGNVLTDAQVAEMITNWCNSRG